MTDRMPTPGTLHGARVGEMASPVGPAVRHKLHGVCPDNQRCRLTPSCSQLCSRLQAAEIAEEMRQSAKRTRNGAGSVATFDPLDIRDVVTSRAEEGHPIVVPDPGTDHGRALVKTLGAHIEGEDPAVEPDTTPDIRPDAEEPAMDEPDDQPDQPYGTCKTNGCDEPAAAKAGPYARLCTTHAAEKKALGRKPRSLSRRAVRRKTVKPPPSATNGKVSERTKLQVLHDLTDTSGQIEKLRAQLFAREQEFAQLADEFAKARL